MIGNAGRARVYRMTRPDSRAIAATVHERSKCDAGKFAGAFEKVCGIFTRKNLVGGWNPTPRAILDFSLCHHADKLTLADKPLWSTRLT